MKMRTPKPDSDELATVYRCSPNEIDMKSQTKLHSTWIVRTPDTLQHVLGPSYFDDVKGHGLRARDWIEVIAGVRGVPEDALLRIDSVRDHVVTVTMLAVYEPAAPTRRAA